MHKQFSIFLENTKYLTTKQHGFRRAHSNTSATTKFIDDILLDLDKGYYTVAVFLDIKKDFDTINHNILVKKLKLSGVSDSTAQIFSNYLSNRKQSV